MMSQQGQEIEFEKLLLRNNPVICKVCWQYCGGSDFCFEELRSLCVIELWHEFGHFRGESKESTWVYQISLHVALRYIRNPHNSGLPPLTGLHEARQFVAGNDGQKAIFLLEELSGLLTDEERHLFDSYLGRNTYSEIATRDGITETTARKRMSRLLKKLKMLIHNNY